MKNLLIFSIVGAVAVAGLAVYLLFSGSSDTYQATDTTSDTVETKSVGEENIDEPFSGYDSLKDLLLLGQNLECNIRYSEEISGNEIEGTYFTSRGRVRGDFVVPSEIGQVVSSIIIRDQEFYTWSDIGGEKYGMKASLNDLEKSPADESAPSSEGPVSLDERVNYECKPWLNVDGSIFEPPSDVLFRDYSQLMEAGMQFGNIYEEADTSASCSSCNQLTGEAKSQCLLFLGCE